MKNQKPTNTTVDIHDFFNQIKTGIQLFGPIMEEKEITTAFLKDEPSDNGDKISEITVFGSADNIAALLSAALVSLYEEHYRDTVIFPDFIEEFVFAMYDSGELVHSNDN